MGWNIYTTKVLGQDEKTYSYKNSKGHATITQDKITDMTKLLIRDSNGGVKFGSAQRSQSLEIEKINAERKLNRI